MDIYIAKKDDTVLDAAKRCGVSPWRLAADNALTPSAPLAVGQALTVRRVRTFHTVRHGETIREIAARYGVTVRAVYRMNPALGGLPRIGAGQTLAVQMADTPKRQMRVLGLTAPHPAPLCLHTALPFLTYIAPHTCHIAPNGGLPIPDTAFLFATARDYGVLPLIHADGTVFAANRFTQTAFYAVMQSGAAGLVTAYDNPALATRLAAANRLLLNTFPTVFLHGCDCGEGQPPVGLSNKEIFTRAVQYNAKIQFDDSVQRPYFCYCDAARRTHTVWFYDPRSWHAQTQQTNAVTVPNAERAVPLLVFLSACRRIVE